MATSILSPTPLLSSTTQYAGFKGLSPIAFPQLSHLLLLLLLLLLRTSSSFIVSSTAHLYAPCRTAYCFCQCRSIVA